MPFSGIRGVIAGILFNPPTSIAITKVPTHVTLQFHSLNSFFFSFSQGAAPGKEMLETLFFFMWLNEFGRTAYSMQKVPIYWYFKNSERPFYLRWDD